MRSLTPRRWTALVIGAFALPALTITAWPIVPFLQNLVPDALPLGRILWGLLLAAASVGAVVLARTGTGPDSLWLGWLIAGAWAVATSAITAMTLVLWLILGSPSLNLPDQLPPHALDAIATRAFAVVAGLGGVAFLVIAYRRQQTTEADARRAEQAASREVAKLFTDTFDNASDKLGSEHAAVRLAGIHSLARLADEAPEEREDLVQMVIDVLCAYLRMPYSPLPEPLLKNASKSRREEHRERELAFASFREVRHSVIRIIGDRLRRDTRWRGKVYDFTGVVFDGGEFYGVRFSAGRVHFGFAVFSGGRVNFGGAEFTGAHVDFGRAKFDSGMVDFRNTKFSDGWVLFLGAEFSAATVPFTGAQFSGGNVHFTRAIGPCPKDLIEAQEKAAPDVLRLSEEWEHPPEQDKTHLPPASAKSPRPSTS